MTQLQLTHTKAYMEQGFAVFPRVMNPTELDAMLSHLSDVHAVGSRCLLDALWCQKAALVVKQRVVDAIPELDALRAVQCTYFDKSAEANWFVALHQDRSIPVDDTTPPTARGWSRKEGTTFIQPPDCVLSQLVALRLHIDDCDADNGPMRVLPTTHRHGTLSADAIDRYRNHVTPVSLTVRRGGVVAMRPLILHASAKSRTPRRRRVLHFLYGPSSLPDELTWKRMV